jgi:type 1 glutamine amidotransferase
MQQLSRFTLLVLLALLATATVAAGVCCAAEDDEGFRPIFNGKNLDGWDGNPKFWRVEDDAITGQTTKENPTQGNTFCIWSDGKVDDFVLRFEYRMVGGNSGVQYRSFEEPEKWGKWVVGGYQADIEAGDTYTGILYAERDRGILATRGQKVVIRDDHKPEVVGTFADAKELGAAVKKEDWNQYEISAKGFTYVHIINGKKMVEVTDEDKAMRRRSGIVALQVHAGPPMKVQFRNIRLKRIAMEGKKKLVYVAGSRSHGYASHAHYAGCVLMAKLLNQNVPGIYACVYRNGWPKDPTALDNADAVILYSDGGGGNPFIPQLDQLDAFAKQGKGIGLIHYAVEVPKGKPGDCFLQWTGGYFEAHWSVNPFWVAEFKQFPDHPIASGLKPFAIEDEWYYHMRFPENMEGVVPVLSAVPPEKTREGPDGPHSGNPTVRSRKGMAEHLAWARQRPDGGRGFGFTGGHSQWNFGSDNFRKALLNAAVWLAKVDVPADGVPSKTPTLEELEQNQDYDQPGDFPRDRIRKQIDQWNQ